MMLLWRCGASGAVPVPKGARPWGSPAFLPLLLGRAIGEECWEVGPGVLLECCGKTVIWLGKI